MNLKSVEINGFKSFAKKTELEFNSAISSIVGPNGSGKSNVAEAFRFVLGEQSIKSLRGKKGEDLIFNGAGETGRSNRASVKLIFDNRNRLFNLDFDEVSIERIVHRDSINEYLINGSQVRLKDILELLASAHIGSSGHHIISQGEADKILNASIRDRKSMLEDALGLKIFQYKKKESERKLLKTEENMNSVEALRKEIGPHLRFLKKQVEKIEKTIQLKEELKSVYKEYLKREEIYLEDCKKKLEDGQSPLKSLLKELENKLSKAKEILSNSSRKDKKSAEIIFLEEKMKSLRIEKDSLVREIGKIEGEISAQERMLKRQKELVATEANKTVSLKEVEDMVGEITSNVDDAFSKDEILSIKNVLKRIKEIVLNFISKNSTKKENETIFESEKEIEKLLKEKKVLDSKLESLKKDDSDLFITYQKLKNEIEQEKDSNRQAEMEVFKIMSEQNEVISKLNTLKGVEDKLRIETEDFKRELSEAGVLIGREVLNYKDFVISSVEEALKEERKVQEDRRRNIEKIKIRIEEAGGGSGDEIMKEFKEVSERDQFFEKELLDLGKSAESLRQLIKDLEEKLNTEFKIGVEKINKQFQEFFTLMFGGGHASLDVVKEKKRKRSETSLEDIENGEVPDGDELDEDGSELEEGIDIQVSLPKKKIKGLVMLSGGERALTSIALIFAVSQVNPPPFIILDETDAALDEANSRKYGDMIENLSKYSQLILITHNRETMSRAGIIYGVTMMGGVSKILSIKFDEAVLVAK